VSTPLPPIDTEQVAQFWERFCSTGAVASSAPPNSVEPFSDSVELADELIELVLHGAKRATAGALMSTRSRAFRFRDRDRSGSPPMAPGGLGPFYGPARFGSAPSVPLTSLSHVTRARATAPASGGWLPMKGVLPSAPSHYRRRL
jgi:hypothetical protein